MSKSKHPAILVIAILAVFSAVGAVRSADPSVVRVVEPDYHLTFTPALPAPGKEVVAAISSRSGLPAGTSLRWNVSGSPFANAGVKDGNPLQYAFTPAGPGTYVVNVEMYNAQGSFIGMSTLEMSIGGGLPVADMGAGQTPIELYITLSPEQPRIGRDVSLTFVYGTGIPEGAEVRWEVSGGSMDNPRVSGRSKETYTFVPNNEGPFHVRAMLNNPQGLSMGEISLGFIPMP